MAKNQKSYTPEFKQQIVDLYNAEGTSYPQLEREYGVNRSTISGWVKQLSPIKVSEEETVTLKEYKALQKEIQRLKIENEILKKVLRPVEEVHHRLPLAEGGRHDEANLVSLCQPCHARIHAERGDRWQKK